MGGGGGGEGVAVDSAWSGKIQLKNIAALTENQCRTRWLLDGFPSHKKFNLLSFSIEERFPRQDAELIFIAI